MQRKNTTQTGAIAMPSYSEDFFKGFLFGGVFGYAIGIALTTFLVIMLIEFGVL